MRPLHEAEMRLPAPEIRRDLVDGEAFAGWQPGHRQDFDAQHEQVLVEGAVMLDVPDHHRRRVALGAGQEHRGAGHARNFRSLDPRHEFADRDQRLAHAGRDRHGAAVPDPHRAIDQDREHQRHISAFRDLGEVGEKERTVDHEKTTGDKTCG